MKKFTSTLTMALLCLYGSAQVGSLDQSFNASGTPKGFITEDLVPDDDDYGTAVSSHKDGRVVVAAYNADGFLGKLFTLFRYQLDGTPDPSFGSGTGKISIQKTFRDDAFAYAVKVLNDNTILAAGTSWNNNGIGGFDFVVAKFLEDGTLDASFGTGGWTIVSIGAGLNARDEAHAIAVQPDGKIVVAGFSYNGTDNDFAVIRLNANGSLDATGPGFGSGGKVTTHISNDDEVSAVAIQSDGKIVVGGTSSKDNVGNITAVRYNADGSLDNTGFGVNGIASIDGRFNNVAGTNDLGNAMAIQADGKIVMTGQSSPAVGGNGDLVTIRLTTAGVLDPAFNPGGTYGTIATPGIIGYNHGPTNSDEGARAVTILSNGKMLIGGDTDGQGVNDFALLLLRYNADGSLDNSFNSTGASTIDPTVNGDFVFGMSLVGNRIYLTGPANVTPDLGPGFPANKDYFVAAVENDVWALPLVLSSFYAQKQTSKVVLQWQTSSEEGVKQFVIERSNDGKNYKTIGTVPATGNSSLTQRYSFADQSPYMSAGNYYRLLMQDMDGNSKYSKILIVKYDGQLTTSLSVFPNPTKDLLQVQLPDGMNGTVRLQVIDLNGRVIRAANLAADGHALNTTVDVSTLVNGVYMLKAQAGTVTVTSRFVKK